VLLRFGSKLEEKKDLAVEAEDVRTIILDLVTAIRARH
jgi:hypothetical protein